MEEYKNLEVDKVCRTSEEFIDYINNNSKKNEVIVLDEIINNQFNKQ